MKYELVVVGASLGGVRALRILLSGLGAEFPLPVAIVQHRVADEDPGLAGFLQESAALRVSEVEDKDAILRGNVYVAPADYHLLVERGRFELSVDEPVSSARPSVDVLFESASEVYGEALIGVVLTGSSSDGARGAAAIKARKGMLIIQDPETAESPKMPLAAREAAEVDQALPIEKIGPFLVGIVGGCFGIWARSSL